MTTNVLLDALPILRYLIPRSPTYYFSYSFQGVPLSTLLELTADLTDEEKENLSSGVGYTEHMREYMQQVPHRGVKHYYLAPTLLRMECYDTLRGLLIDHPSVEVALYLGSETDTVLGPSVLPRVKDLCRKSFDDDSGDLSSSSSSLQPISQALSILLIMELEADTDDVLIHNLGVMVGLTPRVPRGDVSAPYQAPLSKWEWYKTALRPNVREALKKHFC